MIPYTYEEVTEQMKLSILKDNWTELVLSINHTLYFCSETKWNVTGGRVQPAPCDDQSDQTLLFSKEDTLGMIRGATTMFIQISE